MKYSKSGLLFFTVMVCIPLYAIFSYSLADRNGRISAGKLSDYKITGRVLDENDSPVAGVQMSSMITDRPPRGRTYVFYSDDKGNFVIDHVEPGNNSVITEKESDGYASSINGLLATGLPPQVLVDESHPEANVTVKLGPRSPRISGRITDRRTGKLVKDAGIVMCSYNDPKNCFTTSIGGEFSLLAPTVSFTLTISSPDHKEWKFAQNGDSVLTLAGGMTKELVITLDEK